MISVVIDRPLGAYLTSSIDDLTIIFHTLVRDTFGKCGFYSWIICIHKVALTRFFFSVIDSRGVKITNLDELFH